jgi:hypothetical protein
MTNRLMISAAALALIAGTGLANAQGANREPSSGASGGAAVQEHGRTGSSSDTKATRSEQKSPEASQKQRAEEKTQGQNSKNKGSGNEAQNSKAEDRNHNMKSEGREGHNGNMKAEGHEGRNGNMKAEGHEGRTGNMKAEEREGRTGNMNAETKGGTESKSQSTTGQAGVGAKLSTEQRTRITGVIRDQRIAPENNVNFSIAVGTRVPREGVTLHQLPGEVVSIYPQWRGYEFIQVRNQILVIDPATLEIVAILEA